MSRATSTDRRRRLALKVAEERAWRLARERRRRRLRVTAIALLLVLVVGIFAGACGISEGTVVDKGHRAAWIEHTTRVVYDQTCRPTTRMGADGRMTTSQQCTSTPRYVPDTIYHPEKWWLDLRNSEGETGTVGVSETTYNATSVGDYYPPK